MLSDIPSIFMKPLRFSAIQQKRYLDINESFVGLWALEGRWELISFRPRLGAKYVTGIYEIMY